MSKSSESQSQLILSHMQSGQPINPIVALNKYGCFRLSARIYDLKQSWYVIRTEIVERKGKEFAQYSLVGEV